MDGFRDHDNVRDATVLEGVEDAAHQLHRAAARDIEAGIHRLTVDQDSFGIEAKRAAILRIRLHSRSGTVIECAFCSCS